MDQNKRNILKHFIGFCKKELNIQSLPTIKLVRDKRFVEEFRSFGEYNPNNNTIKVFITGRNLADVCRSLAHELTHHRQNELDLIYNTAGETGTEVENDANAMAGILMRDYGKLNLGVYDLDTVLNEDIKIALYPGKKGVDVDFTNKDIKDAPKVQIPLDKLVRNEPAKKMKRPESIETLKDLVGMYRKGKKMDPILVRKKGDRFQILDGHHRFTAAKLAGLVDINAIIVPEENITPVDNDGNVLNERKQVGNLYHFTSYTSLIQIINSGFVLTTKHKDIQPYVSFTRNKSMYSDSISTQARLTIDGNRLTDRYKLSPHADAKAGYGRTSTDESEERVSLIKYPKGVDVSKSLVEVTIRKINPNIDWDDPDSFQDSEDFVEPPSLEDYNTLINLLKKKNIPFKIVDNYK